MAGKRGRGGFLLIGGVVVLIVPVIIVAVAAVGGPKAGTPSTTGPPAGNPTASTRASTTLSPEPKVVFSLSGSNGTTTAPFTVSHQPWDFSWSFNCAAMNQGQAANFIVTVRMGNKADANDEGPDLLARSGAGTAHFYDTGTFNLQIESECRWHVTATA